MALYQYEYCFQKEHSVDFRDVWETMIPLLGRIIRKQLPLEAQSLKGQHTETRGREWLACFRREYVKRKPDTLNTSMTHTNLQVNNHQKQQTHNTLWDFWAFPITHQAHQIFLKTTSGVLDSTEKQFTAGEPQTNTMTNNKPTNRHFSRTDVSLFSVFFLYTSSISLSGY